MTYDDFIELVWNMRSAQREYFETRNQTWLREAKRFEAEVDRALCEDPRTRSLFDKESQ